MKIDAILWDYDGTLVNSVSKNIDITKQIISVVAPKLTGINTPKYLRSEKEYYIANHQSNNWQDLYVNYYGMSKEEMMEAGKMWAKYQLKNETPVKLFSGIAKTVSQIQLPQGICSQNSSKNINQVLVDNNLNHKFKSIVGYDDIPLDMQKPLAFGGIECLKQIFEHIHNKTILYIGDHEGDVKFARNIEKELDSSKVISVVAKYSGANVKSWTFKPDFELETPTDILEILNGLINPINKKNK